MKLVYNVNAKPKEIGYGKVLVFALQQMLAILAATIAVPMIVGNGMSTSAALFGAGVGTIVYLLFTKFRSPVFLGSSFAFIGSMQVAFAGAYASAVGGYAGLLVGAVFAGLVYVVIALVVKAKEAGTPIICAMGAGNKMDPTRFEVTDIYKTSVCPLAKVMRTECRKRKIKHLKVVYSKEPVMTPIEDDSISCKYHCICPPGTQRKCTQRRSVPGSNAFVPSVVGLIIGGEVVKDLVGFVPMKG